MFPALKRRAESCRPCGAKTILIRPYLRSVEGQICRSLWRTILQLTRQYSSVQQTFSPNTPTLQYSNTPILEYSSTPVPQYRSTVGRFEVEDFAKHLRRRKKRAHGDPNSALNRKPKRLALSYAAHLARGLRLQV